MSDGRELCEAGCLAFYGGEVKHHKDCVHYPESRTKMFDDLQAEHAADLEALVNWRNMACQERERADAIEAQHAADLDAAQEEIARLREASDALGFWLSAALEDNAVCDEMKGDINRWFDALAETGGK